MRWGCWRAGNHLEFSQEFLMGLVDAYLRVDAVTAWFVLPPSKPGDAPNDAMADPAPVRPPPTTTHTRGSPCSMGPNTHQSGSARRRGRCRLTNPPPPPPLCAQLPQLLFDIPMAPDTYHKAAAPKRQTNSDPRLADFSIRTEEVMEA
jgi:hypothetical protein